MTSSTHHGEAPPLLGPPNGPGTFPRAKKNNCESPSKFSSTSSHTNSSSLLSPCSTKMSLSSTSSSPCSTLKSVAVLTRTRSQTSVESYQSKVVATGLKHWIVPCFVPFSLFQRLKAVVFKFHSKF